MGSSEYEFGALPQSLKRICKECQNNKYTSTILIIKKKKFILYYNEDYKKDIKCIENTFKLLSTNKKYDVRLKEDAAFDKFFEDEKNRFFIDFWWDIQNDYFIFPIEKTQTVMIAIEKLLKRKYYEK